jgi:hypothetical protein
MFGPFDGFLHHKYIVKNVFHWKEGYLISFQNLHKDWLEPWLQSLGKNLYATFEKFVIEFTTYFF